MDGVPCFAGNRRMLLANGLALSGSMQKLGDEFAAAGKTPLFFAANRQIVGIFAEGRRVKAGEDVAAKAGVALFAMKGNAPVIPCAISGTYKFRSKLTIRYGEPLTLDEFRDKKLTTELMGEITKVIMDKVEELKVKK